MNESMNWPPPMLRQSRKKLYRVFGRHKATREQMAQWWKDGDDEAELFKKSLGEMGWCDFGEYPWKALTTWGDLTSFKFFLPRLLELLASDLGGCGDIGVLLGKLRYGGLDDWTDPEREAVLSFLSQVFDYQVNRSVAEGPCDHDGALLHELLEGSVRLGVSMERCLGLWRNSQEPYRSQHLSLAVLQEGPNRMKGGLSGPLRKHGWGFEADCLNQWLFGDWVGTAFTSAIAMGVGDQWAKCIEEAHRVWGWGRSGGEAS